VDLPLVKAVLKPGVEQIALGQEVFEGSGYRRPDRAADLPADQVRSWKRRGPAPDPGIENGRRLVGRSGPFSLQKHPCTVIGEMKETSGQPDRNRVSGVEAEEPDPGISTVNVNIRSDIGLMEAGQPCDGRQAGGADTRHGEGYQAHVGLALEKVEFQLPRNQRADQLGGKCPVQEQQLPPVLPHHQFSLSGSHATSVALEERKHTDSEFRNRAVAMLVDS